MLTGPLGCSWLVQVGVGDEEALGTPRTGSCVCLPGVLGRTGRWVGRGHLCPSPDQIVLGALFEKADIQKAGEGHECLLRCFRMQYGS